MKPVIVVGAGLGGLATATLLAQAGAPVTLLEQGQHPGGRARTQHKEGFALNLGPHALYLGGPADRVLQRLGFPPARLGQKVQSGGLASYKGALSPLPGTPASFLTTPLLSWRDRASLAAILAWKLHTPAPPTLSAAAWLDTLDPTPTARALLEGLLRLATYCAALDRLSAPRAQDQLQRALTHGVVYLDGGWGRLVEGLTHAFLAAGGTLLTGVGMEGWEGDGLSAGGRRWDGDVVLAVPRATARRFLPDLPAATPVEAACLDVALRTPPSAGPSFVLGLDAPLYLSNHSRWADLGPGSLLHVARYLAPGAPSDGVEEALEGWLDTLSPGWRSQVVTRRFLPRAPVAGALEEVGVPRPAVAQPRCWLVGDWVGEEGWLLDASLASAEAAAAQLLAGRRLVAAA